MDTKNFFFYFYFAYYMCKRETVTHSGDEPTRRVMLQKWVDKCQVYKNSAVYAR